MRTNTSYLLFIIMVSAMGGLLFGYDFVVIGGAKIFYEPFFGLGDSASLRGWAMGCALIGCLVGALLAGVWSDRYGRKKMLITAAMLFVASATGTGAAGNFTWFVLFRLLGGLGIGIASNISPIYIAEVSPAQVRGRYVSLNQLAIVTGILLAQLTNWLIGKQFTPEHGMVTVAGIEWAWRWMFWASLVPAALFLVLSLIIPESPRWLAINQRIKEAKAVFGRIGGEQFAVKELEEIGKLESSMFKVQDSRFKRPPLEAKPDSPMQAKCSLVGIHGKILIIGVVLAIFQQWCGINVIFNYADEIFTAAGYTVSEVLMNIVVTGVTNVIFTFVAIYTVDRWGRKALMYVGSAGLALIYTAMGFGYYFHISGLPMLLLVVLAIACFAMSLGPTVWVILSEIFPARIRGAAMALSTFFLWAACFVLTYTFPLLNASLQASGTFWLYGGICLAGFLFILFILPETKGKSLEEIEKEISSDCN
jgi:SP family sugar porter-like MFS transporter